MASATAGYYAAYGDDLLLIVDRLTADYIMKNKIEGASEVQAFKDGAVSLITFMENCFQHTQKASQELVEAPE